MLSSLSVKQFALIESVHLEFDSGMTVFTGETGAGKSMLVDALGAVFGSRAQSDWVRHGADKAEVTAVWDGSDARIDALLEEAGIDAEENMILRRVIGADGRSRAYVNGVPVALRTVQQLGAICLDLHGQHEHQALMHESVQQQLLDQMVDASLLAAMADSWQQWHGAYTALRELDADRGDSERQAQWMRDELARLQRLEPGEDVIECLQNEVDAGRHYAQIQQAAAQALMLLDEGESNARELVARAAHAVAGLTHVHEGLRISHELLDQIDTLLGEATPELAQVLDQTFDEHALRVAEERLMGLHDAMRRHATDEAGLLQLMQQWEEKLARLDTAGWDQAALQQQLDRAAELYLEAAAKLTQARMECGTSLVRELRPYLDRLALAGMQVRFRVEPDSAAEGWRRDGRDRIWIEVMSNPGEPWRELAAVASGGELSRMVLAFKGCGVLAGMPHIAVFDEVDTGIGGETAWCVGELLAAMAEQRQVLVISHLPQVASCADHQVVISKAEKDGRTVTSLRTLDEAGREQEIARMLGGMAGQSLVHAREMLQRGRKA